jgi:hypothetical protein
MKGKPMPTFDPHFEESGALVLQYSTLVDFWENSTESRCACGGKQGLAHMLSTHWGGDVTCPVDDCGHKETANLNKFLGHLVMHKRGDDERMAKRIMELCLPEGPLRKTTKACLKLVLSTPPAELLSKFSLQQKK